MQTLWLVVLTGQYRGFEIRSIQAFIGAGISVVKMKADGLKLSIRN